MKRKKNQVQLWVDPDFKTFLYDLKSVCPNDTLQKITKRLSKKSNEIKPLFLKNDFWQK